MTTSTSPLSAASTTDFCSFDDAKTRQQFDLGGEGGKSFSECFEMLIGEDRCRRQNSDLFSVHHGLERRTHRDLGLAVADIADDQPVHRRRRFPYRP